MEKQTGIDKLNKMKKEEFDIVTIENLKKKNTIKNSIEIQNTLSKKSGFWSGEKEIRKWREKL